MTTDPYGQGVTWLDYGDKPDLKVMGDSIAIPLAQRSNMIFQNATARDATIETPIAGMEAWLLDQMIKTVYDGGTWAVMSAGSQLWTSPALASGYTNNSNDNGTVQYRIINEFGSLSVMWRGGVGVPYSGGSPTHTGNFLNAAMPTAARPTSRRTVTAACSAVSSDSLSVKIDFNSDGTVQIVTQGGVQPPWVSLNNIRYSL
ncbi:hypothetical protein [Streptomyces sp. DW26H14]|uniref:hypothetical protein n=1 Tax=Streptomyces sp. DW26H14 TaxID=3435395 RepID=UPI00403D9813